MDFLNSIFTSEAFYGFVGGLIVGAIFIGMALMNHWKTRRELKRFQKMLNDKLQLEADHMSGLKGEIETLKNENENLRMKVNSGNNRDSAHTLERELEIFARAEKTMVKNAPGFAPAWQTAKEGAATEIEEEERGKSLPRRIFRKFFAGSGNEDGEKLLAMKESDIEEAEISKEKAAAGE